jgi:UDP-N-acetylmuramoyl-L-alanyl-D-glutamate--2,6-diaminopimelate ligase
MPPIGQGLELATLIANNSRFDEFIRQTPSTDLLIKGLSMFAYQIRPGWAYVAIDTPWLRGHELISIAVDRGAAVVVMEPDREMPAHSCPVIIVDDTARAYSELCAAFWGNVQADLRLYAITGTKGKTTTCHLLASILKAAGFKTGLICTGSCQYDDWSIDINWTTPEPFALHRFLRAMRDDGVTDVVIEASSIGLTEGRLHGLHFDGVGFTNLGRDHLEYHGGLINYGRAKAALFAPAYGCMNRKPAYAINWDDDFGRTLISTCAGDATAYGLDSGAFKPRHLKVTHDGIDMQIGGCAIHSALIGTHNVYNVLCAAALGHGLGISPDAIADGIAQVRGVPGRLEQVGDGSVAKVFVDYAHTAESVSAVLTTIRSLYPNRAVTVVIGCGGGRDAAKRPAMTTAALALSELCILTSDNSRWERTEDIIEDMLAGTDQDQLVAAGRLDIVSDRRQAIFRAVGIAIRCAGVAAILGRGCEPVLEMNGMLEVFDDRDVAYEALREYSSPAASIL